jgi:hypothetical protein
MPGQRRSVLAPTALTETIQEGDPAMPNIVHRISTTKATPDDLFQAVSTREGLATWWSRRVVGTEGLGGVLEFLFSEDDGPKFEVIELVVPSRITLRCVVGPNEWIGTDLEFRIATEDEDTVLLFAHRGWREEVPFMHHCSTQWAYFLLGLREYFETGEGRPYGPRYAPISNWAPPTPET